MQLTLVIAIGGVFVALIPQYLVVKMRSWEQQE